MENPYTHNRLIENRSVSNVQSKNTNTHNRLVAHLNTTPRKATMRQES